jgi:hypothetical protein
MNGLHVAGQLMKKLLAGRSSLAAWLWHCLLHWQRVGYCRGKACESMLDLGHGLDLSTLWHDTRTKFMLHGVVYIVDQPIHHTGAAI